MQALAQPAEGGVVETSDEGLPPAVASTSEVQSQAQLPSQQASDATMAALMQEVFDMEAAHLRLQVQADEAQARCLALEEHREIADEQKETAQEELKEALAKLEGTAAELRAAQEKLDRETSPSAPGAGHGEEQLEPDDSDVEIPDDEPLYIVPKAQCGVCCDAPAAVACEDCPNGGVCIGCFRVALEHDNLALLSVDMLKCPACNEGSVHPQVPLMFLNHCAGMADYDRAIKAYKSFYSGQARPMLKALSNVEHEIAESLVRKTPCCGTAFVFDWKHHCTAISCHRCKYTAVIDGEEKEMDQAFCYFCLEACPPPETAFGEDPAHHHVRKCRHNKHKHTFFDGLDEYMEEQERFVTRVVKGTLNKYRPALKLTPKEFSDLRERLLHKHWPDPPGA